MIRAENRLTIQDRLRLKLDKEYTEEIQTTNDREKKMQLFRKREMLRDDEDFVKVIDEEIKGEKDKIALLEICKKNVIKSIKEREEER